ncbi:MAG: hypothetical protein M5U15_00575 [Kiritimatiellae bacterium]|nr:hypothetical protein [Kiritimatiellia bacterium]
MIRTGPNGGPTDDYDNDGTPNQEEFWADTDPADNASFPQIKALTLSGQTVNVTVDKVSDATRTYIIQTATQLQGGGFNWQVLGTNISTTGVLPVNDPADPVLLFRVTVPPLAP